MINADAPGSGLLFIEETEGEGEGHRIRTFRDTVVSLISMRVCLRSRRSGVCSGPAHRWSHRHVINSNPETREQAEAKGTLDKWVERANDPRFILQMERKERAAAVKANGAAEGIRCLSQARGRSRRPPNARRREGNKDKKGDAIGPQMHRDWSNVMGGGAGAGGSRVYPAKFAFGITEKDCVDDFVVFTTSAAGAVRLRHVL
jgi:hypothetical protein